MTIINHVIIVFCLAVGLHLLVWRISKPSKFLFYSLLFTAVLVGFDVIINWCEQSGSFLFNGDIFVEIFILMTLWQLFLTFFINLLNSVSLKMIGKMRDQVGQEIAETQLLKLVPPEGSVLSRYERMAANGFIECHNDRIRIRKKGIILARVFVFLKKILLIPKIKEASNERT